METQEEIHEMVFSEDVDQRRRAAELFEERLNHLEDKSQAWQDLIHLTQDQDRGVRWRATGVLGTAFSQVPDKDQAWKDLIRLTQDKDGDVRWRAADALGTAFNHVPNRALAWQDLHRLTQDEDIYRRWGATGALAKAFNHVPDKALAWQDLHGLTQDEDSNVRWEAAGALATAFGQVPGKSQAWKDLIRLTQDEDGDVRWRAADALGTAFNQVPNKALAWPDLHRLTQDEDRYRRWGATGALATAFGQIPDTTLAWQDLHGLTRDENSGVRWRAAGALATAFRQVPYKSQAWQDLHRLTQDQDREVRGNAAEALGSAFSQVPDKDQAWKDLIRLTGDNASSVRSISNHSLGRISILKATEADDEFKAHLEEAIEFFRRSSEEASYFNPAAFCLPFYKSLHSILFTELPKKEEVQRYLDDAERAIGASESREVLLDAVSNLSKALEEVGTYSFDDIILRKRDLRSYTKYCLKVSECLTEARTNSPLASKIVDYALIEKSIPVVDQKIKALFREVEVAAGRLCRSTKGTELEALGKDAYESTRGLNRVDSWIAADIYIEVIVPLLKSHCNRLSSEAQDYLKRLIDTQDTASLEQRFDTLKSVLLASLVQGENDDRRVKELKDILDLHLKSIEFAITNMKTSSGNTRKELYSLKNQIDVLQKQIESQGLGKKELSESLEERDRAMIDRLKKMREEMLKAVRETRQLNATKRDVETILKEIEDLDRLKAKDALGILADLASLAEMALRIL